MPAHARLAVVCCIDPRYRTAVETFIQKKFQVRPEEYDLITAAGGVCELVRGSSGGEWIGYNLEIAQIRHGATTAVLVNHINCSHYARTVRFRDFAEEVSTYRTHLVRAMQLVQNRFPGFKQIYGYIINKEGEEFVLERAA